MGEPGAEGRTSGLVISCGLMNSMVRMEMSMHQYIAIAREVSATGQIDVEFPDLPGCDATGSTMVEAKLNAVDALTVHLERMIADGEVPPRASTLEEIMKDQSNHNWEAIVVTSSV